MASDPKKAFRTHSNYLLAFCTLVDTNYTACRPFPPRQTEVLQGVSAAIRASRTFTGLKLPSCSIDASSIRRALRNAWGTELLLASTGRFADDDLIGVANNWAVVQAYYACYHAAQALTLARGQVGPMTHAKLQQHYASFWVTRRVDLPPWSLGWQSGACRNLPSGRFVQPIHPWKGCDEDTCWNLVAQALRTTREELLRERMTPERERRQTANRKNWHQEEERRLSRGQRPRKKPRLPLPRLSASDKYRLDSGLRPTTIVDYLYRLRIRSNYEDPTMFTDGPEDPSDSRRVHRDLCNITGATLLAHELHVGKLIGRSHMESLLDEWLGGSAASGSEVGLRVRRDLILSP
jgi:hypothetical protein